MVKFKPTDTISLNITNVEDLESRKFCDAEMRYVND